MTSWDSRQYSNAHHPFRAFPSFFLPLHFHPLSLSPPHLLADGLVLVLIVTEHRAVLGCTSFHLLSP